MADFRNFNINGTDVSINAFGVVYDDSSTSLDATNVQNAIENITESIRTQTETIERSNVIEFDLDSVSNRMVYLPNVYVNDKITVYVDSFEYEGTYGNNINITGTTEDGADEYLVIYYQEYYIRGVKYITSNIDKKYTDVYVKIGVYPNTVAAVSGKICYNMTSNIVDIQSDMSIVKPSSMFFNFSTLKNISQQGTLDNWIFTPKIYVGLVNPFIEDSYITKFIISLYKTHDFTDSVLGSEYNFIIGTIDQRNWLLPRITESRKVTAIPSTNLLEFDLSKNGLIVKSGEVLFIELNTLDYTTIVTVGTSTASYDANNKFGYTTDLFRALTIFDDRGLNNCQIEYYTGDIALALQEDVYDIQENITTLKEQINSNLIYTDSITDKKYIINVANGTINLQSLDISRLLVIGHSFVNYSNSPTVDWYLDDGENRAMASSINSHQWTNLVNNQINGTLSLMLGVDFERNYSTDYDFATNWNVTNDYDAICVYLCENAVYSDTMQESWEAMLKYLKTAAPSARIYCTASLNSGSKYNAIYNACINTSNIVFVDVLNLTGTDLNNSRQWFKGDYYYGREQQYYPMGAAYSHPNDYGMLVIANQFLKSMGYDEITDMTYTITLEQATGGTITTPNINWLKDGIVTIRCNNDDGYTISNVTVTTDSSTAVETTQRINNYYDGTDRIYYTFTMPSENVTVTPEWTTA